MVAEVKHWKPLDKLVQQIDETPEFNENSVTIAFTQGSKNESGEFQYVSENIELTAASATAAGVMTSTDKKVVDTAATIPNTIITDGEVEQIDSSDVKLHLTQYQKDESGHYVDSQKQNFDYRWSNDIRYVYSAYYYLTRSN